MILTDANGGWVIGLSFVVALVLMLLPLPGWAEPYRPEWVLLVLIYWAIALPGRVGVGTGWVLGLLMDTLQGSLLGQHALALAVVAYLAIALHQRVRVFPLWQQALTELLLVGLKQLLVLWIRGGTGQVPTSWNYWLPSLTSMLLWPWVFIILRDMRRRFRVT